MFITATPTAAWPGMVLLAETTRFFSKSTRMEIRSGRANLEQKATAGRRSRRRQHRKCVTWRAAFRSSLNLILTATSFGRAISPLRIRIASRLSPLTLSTMFLSADLLTEISLTRTLAATMCLLRSTTPPEISCGFGKSALLATTSATRSRSTPPATRLSPGTRKALWIEQRSRVLGYLSGGIRRFGRIQMVSATSSTGFRIGRRSCSKLAG